MPDVADVRWRGPFASTEVNLLHAEAFAARVSTDAERDWLRLTESHSLGWVTARVGGDLAGFVNVVWDGLAHAWLQDVMVAAAQRHRGVGQALVRLASEGASAAGCEWLHVDFEPRLAAFYLNACGFSPTGAGLIDLASRRSDQ